MMRYTIVVAIVALLVLSLSSTVFGMGAVSPSADYTVKYSISPSDVYLLKGQGFPSTAPYISLYVTVKFSEPVKSAKVVDYELADKTAGFSFKVSDIEYLYESGAVTIHFLIAVSGNYDGSEASVTPVTSITLKAVFYSGSSKTITLQLSPSSTPDATVHFHLVKITSVTITVNNSYKIQGTTIGESTVVIGPVFDITIGIDLSHSLTYSAVVELSITAYGNNLYSTTIEIPSGESSTSISLSGVYLTPKANVTITSYGNRLYFKEISTSVPSNAPILMFTYTNPVPIWSVYKGKSEYFVTLDINVIAVRGDASITVKYSSSKVTEQITKPGMIIVRVPTGVTDIDNVSEVAENPVIITASLNGNPYTIKVNVTTLAFNPGFVMTFAFLYLLVLFTVAAVVLIFIGIIRVDYKFIFMGIITFVPAGALALAQSLAIIIAQILVHMGAPDVLGVTTGGPALFNIVNKAVTYIFQVGYSEGATITAMGAGLLTIASVLMVIAGGAAAAAAIPIIGWFVLSKISDVVIEIALNLAFTCLQYGMLLLFVGVFLEAVSFIFSIVYVISILILLAMTVIRILAGLIESAYKVAAITVVRFSSIVILTIVAPYILAYLEYVKNNVPPVSIRIPILHWSFAIPGTQIMMYLAISIMMIVVVGFVIFTLIRILFDELTKGLQG